MTGAIGGAEGGGWPLATIKKGRYVYYHCIPTVSPCRGRYVKEQELNCAFAEALAALRLDDELVAWLRQALQENSRDEGTFHRESIETAARGHDRLGQRLRSMYEDELDGRIEAAEYERP